MSVRGGSALTRSTTCLASRPSISASTRIVTPEDLSRTTVAQSSALMQDLPCSSSVGSATALLPIIKANIAVPAAKRARSIGTSTIVGSRPISLLECAAAVQALQSVMKRNRRLDGMIHCGGENVVGPNKGDGCFEDLTSRSPSKGLRCMGNYGNSGAQ